MSLDSLSNISDRIRVTNSYKEILSIRDRVWSLSGKIELKQFLDLRDRVEKKIGEFEVPIFNDAKVNVRCSDGTRVEIDPRSVTLIVSRGMKLSDYVFGEYPDAVDYEVIYAGFEDPQNRMPGEDFDESRVELSEPAVPKGRTLRESVERIVRLALKLVNFLFSAYSKAFPNIAEDLRLIKMKLEELFEKITTTYI